MTTSVLSTYYEFFCYEIAQNFAIEEEKLSDGSTLPLLKLTNISGAIKKYSLGKTKPEEVITAAKEIAGGTRSHIVCEIASDADAMLSFNKMPVDKTGRIVLEKKFAYGAFLTKKDYSLPAQNRLNTDGAGEINLYSIMEWEPCETGRLYNVLKLMEREFTGALTRDLKKLCWGFANQYYAYMTLSKNYYVYSNDMYMCTINNYLSLFGIMRSLHDVPQLKAILMEETKNVTADIERYVDFRTLSSDALLANHPGYDNAIYETGDYISNQIDVEADKYYASSTTFCSKYTPVWKLTPLSTIIS